MPTRNATLQPVKRLEVILALLEMTHDGRIHWTAQGVDPDTRREVYGATFIGNPDFAYRVRLTGNQTTAQLEIAQAESWIVAARGRGVDDLHGAVTWQIVGVRDWMKSVLESASA